MQTKATDKDIKNSPSILSRSVRKSLIIYLASAVAVPAICFIFGWRSLDHIGAGFLYGSLGLVLFGALTFAGNTVPAQLSKLSLPKYKRPSFTPLQEAERDDSQTRAEGNNFFFTTLICGAFLLVTGLFLKMLW